MGKIEIHIQKGWWEIMSLLEYNCYPRTKKELESNEFPIYHSLNDISDYCKKTKRVITSISIHHSASNAPFNNAKVIDRWHKDRGWAGIGYHFVILPNGLIQKGRHIGTMPAAVKGQNKGMIAICMVGNFSENQISLTPQVKSLGHLLTILKFCYPSCLIKMHKELAHTECPGKSITRKDLDYFLDCLQIRGKYLTLNKSDRIHEMNLIYKKIYSDIYSALCLSNYSL